MSAFVTEPTVEPDACIKPARASLDSPEHAAIYDEHARQLYTAGTCHDGG
ncbi:MAG TPA: hypothetical protein VNO52_04075 [Methylomirabilota bacterium]|nr:hypothetical protein [Methylomirabilota bacterium]